MVSARGISCGGRLRFAGSELAGSGCAARRFFEVGAPGVEVVDPGLDGKAPRAELVYDKTGGPEVVGSAVMGVDCQPESL